MAQVKLLKIASDGVPLEFNSTADDITLNSFTVQGGGPVLSGTGLDMNNQDVSDVKDLRFNDPTTGVINQTAGDLIVDDIMAKDRANIMALASDIIFGSVADSAGEVDSFKVPHSASIPSATPAYSSDAGYLVSAGGTLYLWDGAAWNDLGVSDAANQINNEYVADEALAARDALYISAADNVSKASAASGGAASQLMGFAKASAADTDPVVVVSEGVLGGFTGLTAGARYYLSATAGAITATIPVGSGNTVVQAGYAKSATALHIHIEQMGRRA
jgi:hypothetical protein